MNVCDLGLTCEEAWISNPEMGFGAFSHFSGPASVYQILPKHAAWLLYTTERIDGRTAAAWGLVNECVGAADLMPRAEAIAAQIARF
ncbi:enoyl-CoA hydratase/isomerase family protein [Polaromonas sp. P1-6]|nr:enoyl-CoA hydratase/isomerase family protein [Polaromonas sp. P1-6]